MAPSGDQSDSRNEHDEYEDELLGDFERNFNANTDPPIADGQPSAVQGSSNEDEQMNGNQQNSQDNQADTQAPDCCEEPPDYMSLQWLCLVLIRLLASVTGDPGRVSISFGALGNIELHLRNRRGIQSHPVGRRSSNHSGAERHNCSTANRSPNCDILAILALAFFLLFAHLNTAPESANERFGAPSNMHTSSQNAHVSNENTTLHDNSNSKNYITALSNDNVHAQPIVRESVATEAVDNSSYMLNPDDDDIDVAIVRFGFDFGDTEVYIESDTGDNDTEYPGDLSSETDENELRVEMNHDDDQADYQDTTSLVSTDGTNNDSNLDVSHSFASGYRTQSDTSTSDSEDTTSTDGANETNSDSNSDEGDSFDNGYGTQSGNAFIDDGNSADSSITDCEETPDDDNDEPDAGVVSDSSDEVSNVVDRADTEEREQSACSEFNEKSSQEKISSQVHDNPTCDVNPLASSENAGRSTMQSASGKENAKMVDVPIILVDEDKNMIQGSSEQSASVESVSSYARSDPQGAQGNTDAQLTVPPDASSASSLDPPPQNQGDVADGEGTELCNRPLSMDSPKQPTRIEPAQEPEHENILRQA